MCTGYNGGGGTAFFTSKPELQKRIEGAGEPQKFRAKIIPSLIAMPCDRDDMTEFCDLIDMGIAWSAKEGMGTFPLNLGPREGDNKEATAKRAAAREAAKKVFEKIKLSKDDDASTQQSYLSSGVQANHACFVGSSRHMAGTNMVHTVGQGHFGGDALPGDAQWRRGEAVTQRCARESVKTDIEALVKGGGA